MRAALGALLAVAVVLAAGCGGGGKSRNAAYANSKADYAAALDQICGPAQRALEKITPTSVAEIVTNGPRIKDIIERAVDKIDNLEPPDDVRAAAEDFVGKSREQASKIDDIVDAARDNDQQKVQEIGSQLSELDKATDDDARAIGAQKCVSPD